MRRFVGLCALAALIAAPMTALAAGKGAGSEKPGELYSIERRNVMGSHEIAFLVGTLPKDAFGTGLTLQGSYTYHFSQLLAWEIVGGTYSFNLSTKLETELLDRFEVKPESARGALEAMVHSNFVFKPLYGKVALLNDTLLTAELFFVVGPALGFFDDQSRPFGFDVGVGLRFFIGQYFSLRLDIRDYAFLPDFAEVDNHIYLSLGLSLTFGFSKASDEEE
jgi:outer membrane beta-barrel protein